MNELIYELAKHAGCDIKTYWTSDDNYKTLAQTEHYHKDDVLEKFAELVIKECFSVMENLETDIKQQFAWKNTEVVCTSGHIKKLKEHFGIE